MLADEETGKPASRLASLVLSIAYLVVAFEAGGVEGALRMLLFCFVPVACIWFPDVLGDYAGFGLGSGIGITKTSPPIIVWYLGWVVLFVPIVGAVIVRL